jgi:hypothetical protein
MDLFDRICGDTEFESKALCRTLRYCFEASKTNKTKVLREETLLNVLFHSARHGANILMFVQPEKDLQFRQFARYLTERSSALCGTTDIEKIQYAMVNRFDVYDYYYDDISDYEEYVFVYFGFNSMLLEPLLIRPNSKCHYHFWYNPWS